MRCAPGRCHHGHMAAPLPAPTRQVDPVVAEDVTPDRPVAVTIVWNDPVNLMSYVTFVLQKLFGYPEPKATTLMLDVHHEGKAAVSAGDKDKIEADVAKLHAAGLWATMQRSTHERLEEVGTRGPRRAWSPRSTRRRPRCCAACSTRCARCWPSASADNPADELAVLTGMRTGPSTRPTDRVLARLLPDFTTEDADLAAGLRSLHEPELIEAKDGAAAEMLAGLPARGGRVELDGGAGRRVARRAERLAARARHGASTSTRTCPTRSTPRTPAPLTWRSTTGSRSCRTAWCTARMRV